jgi:acyloxyacyl hydrolase
LIELLESKQKPDTICKELRFCQGFEQCTLYPKSDYPADAGKYGRPSASNDDPWWKKIILPFFRSIDGHMPLIDMDKDKFSTIETWRGSMWRGKDCDDKRTDVYPGRKLQDSNVCRIIYFINKIAQRRLQL